MRALAQPVAAWLAATLAATLAALRPHALPGGRRDALLGCVGVGLGLLLTEWLSHHWLGGAPLAFLLPMGASAVLLFMLPASPLAQPWSVLGGNVVSALVGVALYRWLGDAAWAAALGGALAVAAMRALRCLHPPGGAMALTAVLGDPGVHHLGWGFVHGPVLVNSVAMLLVALLFHRLTGRRYPHQPSSTAQAHGTQDPPPTHRTGVSAQDLDAALASYGETLDIDRDDLEEILVRAHLHAQRRHWRGVRCEHIMSRDVVSVRDDAPAREAWERLARHRVKALPVLDANSCLAGIVSLHDFFLHHGKPAPTDALVRDLMTREVIVARPEQAIADLVSGFSDGGLHHLPVVDGQRRVVGMVTQSDLVAALFQTGRGG